MTATQPGRFDILKMVSGYAACVLLTFLFVHLFQLFALAQELIGDRGVLFTPFLAIGCSFGSIFLLAICRQEVEKRWSTIFSGGIFCIIALFVPDPAIPVKRIHVFEYLLLSLLVRWTLSHRLSGMGLVVSSILFSALLGMHEEIIQGFHPLRTYGLRDMLVNGLAAAGGSLIWHGTSLFSKKSAGTESRMSLPVLLYLGWLILSALAFVIPLADYRLNPLPFWPLLPLGAAVVCWSCLPRNPGNEEMHGVNALSLGASTMIFYPVLSHATTLPFY